jgi:hypothetical protein
VFQRRLTRDTPSFRGTPACSPCKVFRSRLRKPVHPGEFTPVREACLGRGRPVVRSRARTRLVHPAGVDVSFPRRGGGSTASVSGSTQFSTRCALPCVRGCITGRQRFTCSPCKVFRARAAGRQPTHRWRLYVRSVPCSSVSIGLDVRPGYHRYSLRRRFPSHQNSFLNQGPSLYVFATTITATIPVRRAAITPSARLARSCGVSTNQRMSLQDYRVRRDETTELNGTPTCWPSCRATRASWHLHAAAKQRNLRRRLEMPRARSGLAPKR